jgi:hypothetical protein
MDTGSYIALFATMPNLGHHELKKGKRFVI